ncbi:threonine synthase [Flavobacterium amniphilum]|uniref:threonine synthase n=1 Tax=Flavobacterium amniphilum TaxID=1834035 RepID=UPI00202A63EE|nr:threonine synthase [Flavobacterium amniphilum]MCL9804371.1 threonine synthase [Flavobacterium amniphilum]
MKYYSLNNKQHKTTFQEAVILGLAPDSGLYFPEKIEPLPTSFFEEIDKLENSQIAFEAIKQFIGNEIPENNLKEIIYQTLSFDFPVVNVEKDIYALELFHGPTMAFKDVGARFMSKCLEFFNEDTSKKSTVLVATSGDTGGAVASGFYEAEKINVVILYPKGKISDFQERQLTTLGHNIKAISINGSFDDCQDIVKKAFVDSDLKHINLTSANSINIARWLPQMFYFFFTYKALKSKNKPIIIACPSGNFGNICAGVLAKKLGLPISHFVAATNLNDTVPRFMENGVYKPKSTIQTISNAMDVSNPSNFIRIRELYNDDLNEFQKEFSSYSYSDEETRKAMQFVYTNYNYMMDPHGAVAYLGLKDELQKQNGSIGVFLETAHPVKFEETVNETLGISIEFPENMKSILSKEKTMTLCDNYAEVKAFLMNKI